MAKKKETKRSTAKSPKTNDSLEEGRKSGGKRRVAGTPREAVRGPRRKTVEPRRAEADGFAVVGLGASAGGLDVFKQFFTAMPADAGMAFVLIQHLDPSHESLTAELLARHTPMSVVQAVDEMRVEPNHVYVIPPNKYLTISGEKLCLSEAIQRRGLRMPIDFFFRSLADDQQERAIGVILSGTGSDGTLGVREIKAACGMVMVQAPETCQFDGMARSAIGAGIVDYVLPIEEMPEALVRYVKHWRVNGGVASPDSSEEKPVSELRAILSLLRARIKYDFSCYKQGTLARRIQRRMGLRHVDDMARYAELLRRDSDEVNALYRDLLIGVTNFFREPESWEILEREVVRPLIREHSDQTPIRVWSAGCATGEEPYSIAMLLVEQLQAAEKACDVQVFASDIDPEALAFGRAGIYPENIVADVSPERLRRFFIKGEHTFRINKELRDTVVFAEQNLIGDPPFSKLDLIICRNLLIYLEPDVQQRIFTLFHFALTDGGILFLGGSETIGPKRDLFQPISRKHRLYRRLASVRYDKLEFPAARRVVPRVNPDARRELFDMRGRRLTAMAQQLVLLRFAPACVLVNRKAEVLYLHGPVDDYLQLPSGELAADLIAMSREGLRSKLRAALQRALGDDRAVRIAARVKRGREIRAVRVTIEPLKQPSEVKGLLLVSFENAELDRPGEAGVEQISHAHATSPTGPADVEPESGASYEAVIRQLEEELRVSSDDLQSTIEELETSNEEFRASNEEVTSVNEELQSTNEELETSKEELQSLNEELQTVNSQLEHKIQELESTNNDLNNLLASTEIATIFLDRKFRLKRFTPATTRLLRVRDSDLGRPISDFAWSFTDATLLKDAEVVLHKAEPIEADITDNDGRSYVRRVLPYRDEEHRVDGVVITFADITTRIQQEHALKALNEELVELVAERTEHARRLVEEAPDAVALVNLQGEILQVSRRLEALFGYSRDELLGRPIEMLLPGRLRELHRQQREHYFANPQPGPLAVDWELFGRRKDGREFSVDVQFNPLTMDGQWVALTVLRDVTERKQLDQRIAELADAERQRLGRDLHDSLGQQISALGMLVATLRVQVGNESPWAGAVDKLEANVEAAKSQLRSLSKGLFPVDVDADGLRVTLAELAEQTAQAHAIDCRFECPRLVPIGDNFVATQLYLVAREAVHNAVKHATAKSIVIRLEGQGAPRLSIVDDGSGIPDDVDGSAGMGVRIMRHRCTGIGGSFTFERPRDGGTTVSCTLLSAPAKSTPCD